MPSSKMLRFVIRRMILILSGFFPAHKPPLNPLTLVADSVSQKTVVILILRTDMLKSINYERFKHLIREKYCFSHIEYRNWMFSVKFPSILIARLWETGTAEHFIWLFTWIYLPWCWVQQSLSSYFGELTCWDWICFAQQMMATAHEITLFQCNVLYYMSNEKYFVGSI